MAGKDIQKKKDWLRKGIALSVLVFVMGYTLAQAGEAPAIVFPLSDRTDSAVDVTDLVAQLESTSSTRLREELLVREIFAGNMPSRARTLSAVSWSGVAADNAGTLIVHKVTIYAACDYLGVGNDEKSLRVPLTPETAQRIADRLNCILPTPLIVDRIYQAAPTKLAPQPFSPDVYDITAVSTWQLNSAAIDNQLADLPSRAGIIAGHKKDVVITRRLAEKHASPRVAIYGWHQLTNKPIQPLSLVHSSNYLDYSHGIRLVSDRMEIDGETTSIQSVLMHPEYATLLSGEGALRTATVSY